ncbi:MAG TPA: helix-turn-helix domain-containing protein [Chthonomonadaceae bacterium]|nr:helix-turn-helix domain-containing protein [Chthonomonadaceae bacterium]
MEPNPSLEQSTISDATMSGLIVTGHAFDRKEDAIWNENGVDSWALTYTVKGAGRFAYRGGEYVAQPGDAVLHRPYTLYTMVAEPPRPIWENLWTNFQPRSEWYPLLNWPEIGPGFMVLTLRDAKVREQVEARLAQMHRCAIGTLRMREMFAQNALEEALLWCDTVNPNSEQSRVDPHVQRIMDYLCHNLTEKITLEMLARMSGMSVSGLVHLFRRQVGMSMIQFLELQRLNRAKLLLERTNRRIQTISAEVGYENAFYFSLRFKRQNGISPRDYRKRQSHR